RRAYSSGWGSLTLTTRSAAQASSVATMAAPAAAYSASVIDESSPAPASTRTRWPWATSSRAPSGVSATRCSPFFVSRGTPTIIRAPSSGTRGVVDDHDRRLAGGGVHPVAVAIALVGHVGELV